MTWAWVGLAALILLGLLSWHMLKRAPKEREHGLMVFPDKRREREHGFGLILDKRSRRPRGPHGRGVILPDGIMAGGRDLTQEEIDIVLGGRTPGSGVILPDGRELSQEELDAIPRRATGLLSEEELDIIRERDIPIGSDRDKHGCIRSAGYRWSEKHQKCIRPWELPKDQRDPVPNFRGDSRDEHGCNNSAGYFWSEMHNQCIRPSEIGIEDPTLLPVDDLMGYDVPMEYADEYTAVDIPSSIPVEDEPKKKFWTGGKIAAASVVSGATVAALSLVAYKKLTSRSEGDGSRGDVPVRKYPVQSSFSSLFSPPTWMDKPDAEPLKLNRRNRT